MKFREISKQAKLQAAKQQNCVGNRVQCLPSIGCGCVHQPESTATENCCQLGSNVRSQLCLHSTAREKKRQVISYPSLSGLGCLWMCVQCRAHQRMPSDSSIKNVLRPYSSLFQLYQLHE